MSAETLREAAGLMRERAEAATQGPWRFETAPNGFSPMVIGGGMAVADTFDKPHLSDAKHIASWHPAVALAVADWLDVVARDLRHLAGLSGCALRDTSRKPNADGPCPACAAISVAHAYLGRAS